MNTWSNILTITFACALTSALIASVVNAGESPEPIALLRGVESVRQEVRSGHLELRTEYKTLSVHNIATITVDFDREKRRFVAAAPGEATTYDAYDGSQQLLFDGGSGATLEDPTKTTGRYLFDPRNLGITISFAPSKTLTSCLGLNNSKEISLVGRESVGERPTWHVRVVDTYDQSLDFWIEDAPGFPVHQFAFSNGVERSVTTSTFDAAKPPFPLPERVETQYFGRDGQPSATRVIAILSVELNIPIDAAVFSLKGLSLPVGTAVADVRTHKRVGYWDGNGLSENPPAAPLATVPVDPKSSTTILLFVTATVVLVILLYRCWK